MAVFATDRVLTTDDLGLVVSAQTGDREALRRLCQRFQTPLLAMTLQRTQRFDDALEAIEPLLTTLCQELLLGRLEPADWAARAWALSQALPAADDAADDGRLGLEGYGAIPRVVKRRAIRRLLPELPLPELTALLLKYLDHTAPADMIGLVGKDFGDVELCLIAAHELVQGKLQADPTLREPAR